MRRYRFDLDPHYYPGVTKVRAFYDAVHRAMVQYNIKHGKRIPTKKDVARVAHFFDENLKQIFYLSYEIGETRYEMCKLEDLVGNMKMVIE